jgi:hypothetical protein
MTKLSTLTEAVASISDGAHIALSGFAITRCTMAFAAEVIRQGITKLTVSQCVGAMDADLLAGAGTLERIIYGGGSLDRFGRLNCVNRGLENGTLVAEEYGSLSMAFRYMAVAGARELKDGEIVAVGLGLPVVASFLAKRTHAPRLTMLFELGVVDPEPVHQGVGLADPRVWYRAKILNSFVDMLGTVLHKGLVDVGFLGGVAKIGK